MFTTDRMRTGHKRLLLIAISLCLFSPSLADALDREQLGEECYAFFHEPDKATPEIAKRCQEKLNERPNIVITPTRTEKDPHNVPAAVSSIDSKQIERSGAESVAELLRDVPGVEVSDAGQPGLKRIRLRGEESRRVAILVDGQEFIDEREVGTPLLIAPELIERIEVVRGPGAVLHGSRAIGGVINIITKKGGYHPVQATLSTFFDSGTNGFQGLTSVYGKYENTDYRLSGTRADHDNRDSAQGEIENTDFDNGSVSAYLGQLFGKHKLSGSFERYESSSSVYVDPAVATTPPLVDFSIQAPQRDRQKFGLFFDGDAVEGVWEKLHLDAYAQQSERQFDTFSDTVSAAGPEITSTSIFTHSELDTFGGNAQADWKLPAANYLVAGLKIKDDSLEQNRLRNVQSAAAPSSEQTTVDEASQSALEGYLQNEWEINDSWALTYGGRAFFIETELESSTRPGLSPSTDDDASGVGSASIRFAGFEHTTLWGAFSQGYVYPSLINLATGAFAGPNFVNPDPTLDPERANSFELGAKFDTGKATFELAGFITPAKDYINHVPCSSLADNTCIQPVGSRDRIYSNIDEATTYGLESEFRLALQGFEPYAELSWLRRNYESATLDTYDTGLPPVTAKVGLSGEQYLSNTVLGWFEIYLRAASTATERLSDTETKEYSGWGTLNASIGAKIQRGQSVGVSLDLRNLGDKDYTFATESVPAVGRSAVVKVVIDL